MIDFLRGIEALTGNPGAANNNRSQQLAMNMLQDACSEGLVAARYTLRTNQSEGPPLSESWMNYKEKSWGGGKWFVDSNNDTFQVERPTFALGPHHKGVWTGFLDRKLQAWIEHMQAHVGYRGDDEHPVTGIDVVELARVIHFGTEDLPPRPFLNAGVTIEMARERIVEAFVRDMEEFLRQ